MGTLATLATFSRYKTILAGVYRLPFFMPDVYREISLSSGSMLSNAKV